MALPFFFIWLLARKQLKVFSKMKTRCCAGSNQTHLSLQALNQGLGEGIFYRGRILLALSVEVYTSPSGVTADIGTAALGKVPSSSFFSIQLGSIWTLITSQTQDVIIYALTYLIKSCLTLRRLTRRLVVSYITGSHLCVLKVKGTLGKLGLRRKRSSKKKQNEG